MQITAARLKELVHYDPKTGVLTCLVRMRGKRPGDIAGHINQDGYRRITLDGRQYGGNRLAWLYMTGAFPEWMVDHRDGNPGNDRWRNLREADRYQNMANKRPHRGSASGLKGVYPEPNGRWKALITCRGQRHYLGMFACKQKAAAAYAAKAIELHGEFARLN
jgi:hypothetical protein